jgi:hypothetical protein
MIRVTARAKNFIRRGFDLLISDKMRMITTMPILVKVVVFEIN